ncbi:TPA: hypothetical protein MCU09_003848 [Klebsiella pneumoniae]|nr:hypothetical protein [Klebsiella pneumoniae]
MFNSQPIASPCLKHLNVAYLLLFLFVSFSSHAREWYEGGTLQKAGALDWQSATYENKLATSADLIAKLYSAGKLSPKASGYMKNINNFKVLSEELTRQMDDAFKPFPNKKQNEIAFSNQKVTETAAMLMITMGWVSL